MKANTVSLPPLPEHRGAVPLVRDYWGEIVAVLGAWRVAGVLGVLAVAAVAEAGALLLLAQLMDRVSRAYASAAPLWFLGMPLAAFVAATVLRIGLQYGRDVALLRLRLDYLSRLRGRLYRSLMAAPWTLLARIRHANVLSVLTSDLDRINAGTMALLQGVVSVGVGLVTVGVAVSLSPALIVPAAVAGAVLALPLLGQTARGLSLGQRLTEAHQSFVASATDFLSTLKLVKAQGGDEPLLRHVDRAGAGLDAEQLAFMRDHGRRTALMQIGGVLLVAALLLYGVVALQLPLPTLILSLYLLARLVPLINQGASFAQMVTHMLPAWRAFRQLEDRLASRQARAVDEPASPRMGLVRGIDITAARFRYPDAGHPALDGVDLHIPARRTVALVGPSGAGKTSLADVVLGLLDLDEGQVCVDGVPLDARSRRGWQQAVAYVPQENILLPASVRENLLWNQAGVSDAAVWRALEQAQANAFVRRLPQGLDTVLGEQGAGLSGGERQRLMLARALVRQPQLLVLDEATSHLDTETEQAVRLALRELAGSLTVVLIAHRLSTVRDADLVVLMDRGRVVATGSWDDLLASQPVFAALVAADGRDQRP